MQHVNTINTITNLPSTWVNPFEFVRINPYPHPRAKRNIEYRKHYRYEPIDEKDILCNIAYSLRIGHESRNVWHRDLQYRFELHPAVFQAIEIAPPDNRHLLALEWPHIASMDNSRIAYTRDDRAGREDRQTVTTVGKYLRRHFSKLSDTQIRDIAMRFQPDRFELWDTSSKIVHSVQAGPKSCMQWDYDSFDGEHPYAVYSPQYGWRAAVRLDAGGTVEGRCLVNDTDKIFVRSYKRNGSGYSHSDEALEVWLRDQGYTKASSWAGCLLRYIATGDRYSPFVAPYIDGGCQTVDITVLDGFQVLRITEDGEWQCDHTDGTASQVDRVSCSDCEAHVHDDDLIGVGVYEDHCVCRSCVGENYTYVYGNRGNQYYVHNDSAIYCDHDDNWYDERYLSDNHIVTLACGDICPMGDAVYVESVEEWYHMDDSDVVFCECSDSYELLRDCVRLHDDTYCLEAEAWVCDLTGDYYSDDEPVVELCDLASHSHLRCSREAVDDEYEVDLSDIEDACTEMLEQSAI